MSDDAKVEFVPHHLPALPSGDYTIEVAQTLTATKDDEKNVIDGDNVFEDARSFTIRGPRFTLDPSTLYTRFPPPGSLGDHSNVLPHVSFLRSTLPWERLACPTETEEAEAAGTWLALLVFGEDEARDVVVSQVTKEAVVDGTDTEAALNAKYAGPDGVGLEGWENGEDPVSVIGVEETLLRALVPTFEELKLSAHVRQAEGGEPLALVVAGRLPAQGVTSTVHLVSLENQFTENADGTVDFDPPVHGDSGKVHLVSLHSWEFACVDAKQDFSGLLEALDLGADGDATLRLPDTADEAADGFVRRGYVPLNLSWREGGTLVSWMHGPLIPGERLLYDAETAVTRTVAEAWKELRQGTSAAGSMPYELARHYGFDLPATSADALVRYQQDTGMLDVSYAAAWNLGRLLALWDKAFSVGLYNWKRTVIRALKNQAHASLCAYLPIYGGEPPDAYALPAYQKSWLEALSRLEGVPFNYLVPHESMLPLESIRFFKTDPLWIIALLDGAFSMGRTLASDVLHEIECCCDSMPEYDYDVSGILLRSQAVPGWPDLIVSGFDADGGELTLLREARLGGQVLLCLFSRDVERDGVTERTGELAYVDISQKPEAVHFGLDRIDAEEDDTPYEKELRRIDGTGSSADDNPILSITEGHFRSVERRVLDLEALAAGIADTAPGAGGAALNSAQFGFEMVEGVEAVRFRRASTWTDAPDDGDS